MNLGQSYFSLFGHPTRYGTFWQLLHKAEEVRIELFELFHLALCLKLYFLELRCLTANDSSQQLLPLLDLSQLVLVQKTLKLRNGLSRLSQVCLILLLCYSKYNVKVLFRGGFLAKKDPPQLIGAISVRNMNELGFFYTNYLF